MYTTASLVLLGATLAAAEVHTVDVGESGLSFSPETLTVATGDTVIFHLYPSHDVVSGPFDSPCTPTDGDGGFYSGAFKDTDNGNKKFVVNVTSEDPVYYYCSVQKHCQSGMVGGWNLPSSGDTADAYAAAAKNVNSAQTPQSLTGGELLEDEAISSLTAGVTSSPTASGSGSPTASSGASTTSGASGSSTASGSGTPTASGTGSSTTPTSSNAVDAAFTRGEVGGVLAAVLGVAAYLF
ncbi:hypothetical protein K458DRAFT_412024 [Lentithecium fluviatile CBS 122367]|uniref:Cupredoxin n=1 Tax=Lentithecium fluviatile CBS 122367 TaxID=1168545 RepID=A0A6G1JJL4_9PLEO|nr:hypothetical protein K458DRAFT_412024 [Lentithecium fluviatile CBS 122367]